MHEIAKVTLENEMDLILAHKRSMKLAELAGLSLSAQTTFATAVSEVARNTIESGKSGCLILKVENEKYDDYIVACLNDEEGLVKKRSGLEYAKRLVNKYNVSTNDSEISIELFYHISPPFKIDINKLDQWRGFFRNEPPISAYDELKRKNELLQELSDKVQKSEAQYKTLTNSLPLMIFSIDTEGKLLYANEWLVKFTGETVENLNKNKWKSVVHPDDYDSFLSLIQNDISTAQKTIQQQTRVKNKNGNEYLWHQISLTPFKEEENEILYWIGYIVDIHAQKVHEETLKDNIELKETQKQLRTNQQTLEEYIEELNRSNYELQQFAFVASHDLQEPVRKMLFYSDYLINSNSTSFDEKGMNYMVSMQSAANRMRNLIHDILLFSQINKQELRYTEIDLNKMLEETIQEFELVIKEKNATINVQPLPTIEGDARMMRQLVNNLIGNSLKYSKSNVPTIIDVTCKKEKDDIVISFKDNGIGFDQKYLPQVFNLFQRLHTKERYQGTGLGLAICRKIVEMHHGNIWAEAEEGKGATFYVSLPRYSSTN